MNQGRTLPPPAPDGEIERLRLLDEAMKNPGVREAMEVFRQYDDTMRAIDLTVLQPQVTSTRTWNSYGTGD